MNIAPNTVFTGDNLPILRGMNSESIDLIYLDPPFNSNANYAAPIGSEAAGAEFKDTWTLDDIDVAWLDLIEIDHPAVNRIINAALTDSDKSYLIYMAVRIIQMHRILKDTGSIYLHCDPTMSHYLKLLMDAVFGRKNFRNEIIWHYPSMSRASKWFPKKNDIVLFYTKNDSYIFNPNDKHVRIKYADSTKQRAKYGSAGFTRKDGKANYLKSDTKLADTVWKIGHVKSRKELVGYPTQKPLKLLERIISASSNTGDVVLDPFCGCATACVAADRLHRKWVGIDISPKAAELVVQRIKADQGLFEDIVHRIDVPKRTDQGKIPKYNASENKEQLYGRQGGNCRGCGEHFNIYNLEVDHLIAKSVGGTDHIENLQLLCGHCNRIKGNRGQEYLIAKLAQR